MLRRIPFWFRSSKRNNVDRPLKVLFVITSMPVGGAETLLVNLLDRLDAKRMVGEVVCLKEPGPLGQQISHRVPLHANLLRSKWDLGIVRRLGKLFKERQADAVITVGAGDKMFWGRLAAWFAGVPVIASALHSTGWPDGVGRLNRMLTPLTDGFIAVADSHGDFMRSHERFPADRVHVVRNGIDTDRFTRSAISEGSVDNSNIRKELGLAADTPLVGIVAALRSEKNHGMFLKVAKQVLTTTPNAHFIIVGDGPMRPDIETEMAELQIQDRVHLLGTRHDTPQIVASLDVFLLTSHNEASPVSILEALACETPVVSNDVGSIAESVVHGETGYLVQNADVQVAAKYVSDLLADPDQRKQMGAAGRKLVLRSGSLQAMTDGYQNLVEKIFTENTTVAKVKATQLVAAPLRKQQPIS